jgi:hypothetical protein
MRKQREEQDLSRLSAEALQAESDMDKARRRAEEESRRMRWRRLRE